MPARNKAVIFAIVTLAGLAVAEAGGSFDNFLKDSGAEKQVLAPCLGDTRFPEDNDKPICQHLGFRFCMRLVTDKGEPYIFGGRESENSTERIEDVNKDGLDWWEWSTQPDGKKDWLKGIVATGGNKWCTCALCTSEAVERFGCDNLDIQCNATDMAFIRDRVEEDKHMVLAPGLECLKKKCGDDYQKDWPIVGHDCKHRGCARLYGAGYEHSLMPLPEGANSSHIPFGLAIASFAALLVSVVVGVGLRRQVISRRPLLAVEAEDEPTSNDAEE